MTDTRIVHVPIKWLEEFGCSVRSVHYPEDLRVRVRDYLFAQGILTEAPFTFAIDERNRSIRYEQHPE